jgi:hypothetical protein
MIRKLFQHLREIIFIAFACFGSIWLLIEPLGLFGLSAKLSNFGMAGYTLLVLISLLLGIVIHSIRYFSKKKHRDQNKASEEQEVAGQKNLSQSVASPIKEQKQIDKINAFVEFTLVGELITGRRQHNSVLLPNPNGKVLITGGVNKLEEILASAEFYDPIKKTFANAGRMVERRIRATATLLPDNRVLIAGGQGELGALNSAELYLPSGKFISVGSMQNLRNGHSATLLKNGKVLISGGMGEIRLAEIFDPSQGIFVTTGEMTCPRSTDPTPNAILLDNEKVLIAGGYGYKTGTLDTAEIYDPDKGIFNPIETMVVKRACHTLTLLSNGKVLIVGGYSDDGGHLTSSEIYDPLTGKFTLTQNHTEVPHIGHTATLLPNGKVIVIGGYSPLVEIYDPETNRFSPFGRLTINRYFHTSVLLPISYTEYQILVIGGAEGSHSTAELSPVLEL